MASGGSITVDVEVGVDMKAAIRQIVREEVAKIVRSAYVDEHTGDPAADALAALYEAAEGALED